MAAGDGRGDNIGATGEPCFQANLFGGCWGCHDLVEDGQLKMMGK